jgi:hypothetical protein
MRPRIHTRVSRSDIPQLYVINVAFRPAAKELLCKQCPLLGNIFLTRNNDLGSGVLCVIRADVL